MQTTNPTWALILAAGDGKRLGALSKTPSGHVPKQFCSFCDDLSLLARAVERAARIVPREQILVVVAEQHRGFWEPELADLPADNILVQPRNCGTANGILFGCTALLQCAPDATLLILPSDHFVEDELALRDGLDRAVAAVPLHPQDIVLLGMTPDEPDPDYGWIVPAPGTDGLTSPVSGFVEKPSPVMAMQLMELGALWSSFIMVARLEALLRLFDSAQPRLLDAFLDTVRRFSPEHWPERVRPLYSRLPACDFSRHVLQKVTGSLRLLRMPMIGWSDLGTPQRLERCLQRMGTPAPRRLRGVPSASGRRLIALERALFELVDA